MAPKVVQHPSAENTPSMTVAEAVGISDQMADCCIMWTDHDGNMHIGWSRQSNADLACYAVVLQHIAASRIIAEE
jgi:hypothetical protein